MTYEELCVLIPSHSLEDFPTELAEQEASSLLNAFAVIWHPALISAARVLPNWRRSDDPPDSLENRLVIAPLASNEWLPGGWVEHARNQGAVVISDVSDRNEMIKQAVDPLQLHDPIDPDLVADFLALGSCYL